MKSDKIKDFNAPLNLNLKDYHFELNIQESSKLLKFIKPKLDVKKFPQSNSISKKKYTEECSNYAALPLFNDNLGKKVSKHYNYIISKNQDKNVERFNKFKKIFSPTVKFGNFGGIKISNARISSRNKLSTNLRSLKKEICKEISLDNVNIITYINIKEDIPESLLKKLCCTEENNLVKVDKTCKKALIKEEKDKKFKRFLDDKYIKNKTFGLNEYKRSLDEMEKNLLKAKNIQINYELIRKNKENHVSEKFLEIKNKFWIGKVEKLNKKSIKVKK